MDADQKNTVSLQVEYNQSDHGNEKGQIKLAISGEVQVQHASGRMDRPGDRVMADGFVYRAADSTIYDVSIECVRTSSALMNINFIFSGPPASYYSYGNQSNIIEKHLKDVPITIET